MKYLNVENRVAYLSLNLMYKIHKQEAPKYLLDLVKRNDHGYNTKRSENAFVIPSVNTKGAQSFIYTGIKLWNDIFGQFSVKKFLMKKMLDIETNLYVYY